MSPTTYAWMRGIHLVAVIGWIAALTAALTLLRGCALVTEDARTALASLGRRVGIIMDATATLAIVLGLGLLHAVQPSPLSQPWMHIKLTVVVVGLLAIHVLTRIRLRKARDGDVRPLPTWLPLAIAAVIILVAMIKPLAR